MDCENKKIITFNITNICDYSCDYCNKKFLWEKERIYKFNEIRDYTFENFIIFLKRIKEKVIINLSSDGETLMHERALEAIRSILDNGHDLILSTNFSSDFGIFEKIINSAKTSELNLFISIHPSQINPEKFYDKLERLNSLLTDKKNVKYHLLTTEKVSDLNTKISKNLNKEIHYLDLHINEKPVFYFEARNFFIENFMFKQTGINFYKENQCQAGVVSCEIDSYGYTFRCHQELEKGLLFHKLGNIKKPKKLRFLKESLPCYCENCFYKKEQISIKKNFKNIYRLQKFILFILLEETEPTRKKIKKVLVKIKRNIFGDRILFNHSKEN